MEGGPAHDALELIGRGDELTTITALLDGPSTARLVSLIGPGGVGKTTLARAVLDRPSVEFAAARFVNLAAVTSADGVWESLARSIAEHGTEYADARQLATRELARSRALVVLDNCEQIDGLHAVVGDLLAETPTVIVATSRRRIGVPGEQIVSVEPLPLPTPSESLAGVVDNESVRVLTNAARRRNPSFTVDVGNAAAVAELCRHLDGLPLALELAAARLHLVSPAELLRLLDQRFAVLRVDDADRDDRHRRLWATIDWSYQLLEEADQAAFRRLGTFADGFTLDAAAAVVGVERIEMLDTLDRLAEHHLVQPRTAAAERSRFSLLESIREFAIAELDRHSERTAAGRAHAGWARATSERWGPATVDPAEHRTALDVLDEERANVRAALGFALEAADAELALAIGAPLWRYWLYRGSGREGLTWLDTALALDPPPSAVVGAAWEAAGDLAEVIGDLPGSAERTNRAIDVYAECGLPERLPSAWNSLAHVEREFGHLDRARDLHTRALAEARHRGDARMEASALNGLGAVASRAADPEQASGWFTQALALIRELGDQDGAAVVAGNVAIVRTTLGDLDGAIAIHADVLANTHEDSPHRVNTLVNLAECEILAGRLDDATVHLDRADELAAQRGQPHLQMIVAHHRALLAEHRGQIGAALQLLVDGLEPALRDRRPLDVAELVERSAVLAAELGDTELAGRALAAARAARAHTDTQPTPDAARLAESLGESAPAAAAAPSGQQVDWSGAAAAYVAELAVAATRYRDRVRAEPDTADQLHALGLTEREAEVARMLVARLTDSEIGATLHIATRTVGAHVSAVLRKLGVPSRRDVASRLAELGVDVTAHAAPGDRSS